jgi:hypothetical protein
MHEIVPLSMGVFSDWLGTGDWVLGIGHWAWALGMGIGYWALGVRSYELWINF